MMHRRFTVPGREQTTNKSEHDCWLHDIERWNGECLMAQRIFGHDAFLEIPEAFLLPRAYEAHRRNIARQTNLLAQQFRSRHRGHDPTPANWPENHLRQRRLHERLRKQHEGLLSTLLERVRVVY